MKRKQEKTQTTSKRSRFNKVVPTIQTTILKGLDLKGAGGVVILKRPDLIFDQLTVSVWSEENLFDIFVEKFGRPNLWSVIQGYFHFKNGIFLSRWVKCGWRSIIFTPDPQIIAELYPVLKALPPRLIGSIETPEEYEKCKKEPAAILQKAELAFDSILPGRRYRGAELILHEIAALILPRRQSSKIRPYPRDENKRKRECKPDGTINGEVTYYIDKLEEQENGIYEKAENPSVSIKMYLKMLPRAADWTLRIEVTLQGDALCRRIGKELPHGTQVNVDGRDIQIDDFVQFARFNWNKFGEDIDQCCAKKPEAVQEECMKLRNYARSNSNVAADMISAIQIAKELGSVRLENEIRAGQYYRLINPFLEKPDPNKKYLYIQELAELCDALRQRELEQLYERS